MTSSVIEEPRPVSRPVLNEPPPVFRGLTYYDFCAWVVIAIVIYFQVVRFEVNRGLRYDEARVALNLLDRDYVALMRPLDYQQAAPIFFLWAEKALIDLIGNSEFTLRLLPLLGGLVAPGIFWWLTRVFGGPRVAFIASLIFALNYQIQLYTGELKQYSIDIVISTLFLLMAGSLIRSRITVSKLILFAVAGAVSLWCSHPATFFVAGLWAAIAGRALFPSSTTEKNEKIQFSSALFAIGLGSAFLGASFLLHYRIAIKPLLAETWPADSWREFYAPFPPTNASEVSWYLLAFGDFLFSWRESIALIGAVPFFIGLVSAFRKSFWFGVMLVFPATLAMVASALGRFGFADRQILFLQPFAVYLMAEGINQIFRLMADRWPRISLVPVTVATVLGSYYLITSFSSGEPNFWNKLETRPMMAELVNRIQPGDTVYVTQSLLYPFVYYAPFYNAPNGHPMSEWPGLFTSTHVGHFGYEGKDPEGYIGELQKLFADRPLSRRIWVTTAEITWLGWEDVRPVLREVLEKYGTLEQIDTPGVALFLLTLPEEGAASSEIEKTP